MLFTSCRSGYFSYLFVHCYCALRTVVVKHQYLPYLTCQWLTENSLVAAGYDCYPVLWSHDDAGKLTYINKLDQTGKKAAGYVR